MNSYRVALKILMALILSFTTVMSSRSIVYGKKSHEYSITIKPGESKTIKIPIKNTSSSLWETSYIVITAANNSPINGDVYTLATSSCSGVQKALNSSGNILYQWTAQTQYDFNGTTVDIWGHTGIPSNSWGWSFDHEGWVVTGNGTATASAASTGYFKHPTVGREYARIKFVIQKNGACTLSGSTGTW